MDLRAALALGRELMQLHGLDDWVIQLDRAKTRAGVCRPRTRTIFGSDQVWPSLGKSASVFFQRNLGAAGVVTSMA